MALTSAIAVLSFAPAPGSVHEDRLKQIDTVRNHPGVLWQAGAHPRFAFAAPGASKSLCGVKGNWSEQIAEQVALGEIRPFTSRQNGLALPQEFDSAAAFPACAKIIGDIRDQSNCGCCWAFAGVEAASDRMCISTNGTMQYPISAQDVCFCSSFDGCGGGFIHTPWSYIKGTGAVSGGQYQGSGPFGSGMCQDFTLPHCHHHGPQRDDPYPPEGAPGCPSESSPSCSKTCSASATMPDERTTFTGAIETASGEEEIMKMIYEGGPVETAFTVYSDFEDYVSGVYHHVTGSMAGGHAVKMVGWGEDAGVKYWKVANSWNPYWGEKGYFRIIRGVNEGGIESQVIGTSAAATWTKNVIANFH